MNHNEGLHIDLGCGGSKKAGYIGLDNMEAAGVDYVLDLRVEPFPFANNSVSKVFSSHFFEHVEHPHYFHMLNEIGRVCMDGASIELWVPYAFTNEAFLHGHEIFLTETPWIHFASQHADFHARMLNGRWLFHTITFIVKEETEQELASNGFSVDFALKYFKGVAQEFCVAFTYHSDMNIPPIYPQRWYAHARDSQPLPLDNLPKRAPAQPLSQTQSHYPQGNIHTYVAHLEQTIQQKNAHIAHLEHRIHGYETGRLMRLLRWLGQR